MVKTVKHYIFVTLCIREFILSCLHVNIVLFFVFSLPLLVLIGPPLIAKTSFKVQPSAMLQTQTQQNMHNKKLL